MVRYFDLISHGQCFHTQPALLQSLSARASPNSKNRCSCRLASLCDASMRRAQCAYAPYLNQQPQKATTAYPEGAPSTAMNGPPTWAPAAIFNVAIQGVSKSGARGAS